MTTDAVGGVWTYSLALCRALGEHGVDVMLASMGPRPSDAQRTAAAALGNVTLRESEFRLEWMSDPWSDLESAGAWLLDLEERFAPDVVHLNGYVLGRASWTAPVVMTAHSCVVSWWQAVRGTELPASWNHYRARVQDGLHAASIVVAPSHAMLDTLEVNFGRLANAIVIPNGCEGEAFAPQAKEPRVLSVGRLWDEAKNVQALTDVAPKLAWPVWVAGDARGPDGGVCELPNVRVLGSCAPDVLARHYAQAAIYALPARYEPFGLSILEAAMSGCALVLGDIPSLRENWDGAAVFVPPTDRIRLRGALNALISDEAWRTELAAEARRRALRFTAPAMGRRYFETYQSLCLAAARPDARDALSA
jgi:glycosyltransferase involved in cell wall biosynthesis